MSDTSIPAFPRPFFEGPSGDWSSGQDGMSLRDWFAGQALIGLCSSDATNPWGIGFDPSERAYEVADRMLEEREKGGAS